MTKGERVEFIRVRQAEGQTLQQIGDAIGISRERVRQIAAAFSLPPRAKSPTKDRKPQSKVDWVSRFGCTREERDAIVQECIGRGLKDPFVAYTQQRNGARQRGISWEMNFYEWWTLWQPHYHKRGRERGRYVMCRYLDKGPYKIGNVRIDYSTANANERRISNVYKRNPARRAQGKANLSSFYEDCQHHTIPGKDDLW